MDKLGFFPVWITLPGSPESDNHSSGGFCCSAEDTAADRITEQIQLLNLRNMRFDRNCHLRLRGGNIANIGIAQQAEKREYNQKKKVFYQFTHIADPTALNNCFSGLALRLINDITHFGKW
ncbi:MAG: hypothetical protein GY947_12115 [Rhodobacteraceae bacterium]|nr:hypothetical protein [Paracoccaceae bacterium]